MRDTDGGLHPAVDRQCLSEVKRSEERSLQSAAASLPDRLSSTVRDSRAYRLVGLVVKASISRAAARGLIHACAVGFFRV